jgi:hypothetical protein
MSRTMDGCGIVVGCDSVRLAADGIQIIAKTRVTRIPWRDVTAAALEGRDPREMQMPSNMGEQIMQLRPQWESAGISAEIMDGFKLMGLHATHDALWIKRRDEVVHVLIERRGPARVALLMRLRTALGKRWLGEDLTHEQLEKRFCPMGFRRRLRAVRFVVKLFAALVPFIVVWTLVAYGLPAAASALFEGSIQSLLDGEWKLAVIMGVALVGCVLLIVRAKKALRRRGLWFWPGP